MEGKFSRWSTFCVAYLQREWVRLRIRNLVAWNDPIDLENGCTGIIGMPHLLPDILLGNLKCLHANAWPVLKEVIVIVDSVSGCLPEGLEETAKKLCDRFPVRFVYYSEEQSKIAEKLCLPYVFCWLSWCIGLNHVKTKSVLIHDYDALILDESLQVRWEEFVSSRAYFQGVKWYEGNGIVLSDELATTFEMFLDLEWIRNYSPIQFFNRYAYSEGRSFDYDIFIELQKVFTPLNKRKISPMSFDSLVHPSQMIHQYTVFRKFPGSMQPCYSIPMIPFFQFLSGNDQAISIAASKLASGGVQPIDLFGDGTLIHLGKLTLENVDWNLKQMLQVILKLHLPFPKGLYQYGEVLYALAGASPEEVWRGDFSPEHQKLISHAKSSAITPEYNQIRLKNDNKN